jgi:hypothetical protein
MNKRIKQFETTVLLAYLKNDLSASGTWLVNHWLSANVQARHTLNELEILQGGFQSQKEQAPRPELFQQIQAAIQALPESNPAKPTLSWRTWAYGMGLIVMMLLIVLTLLPPKVNLIWTTSNANTEVFYVYRAPAESEDFKLITTIPSTIENNRYSFSDYQLIPGQTYTYQITAIDKDGLSSVSQLQTDNNLEILPGQIGLILTTLIASYGILIAAVQTLPTKKLRLLRA